MKEVTRFLSNRSYILHRKGERHYFFSMVMRQGDDITFELRDKNNRKQVTGTAFVPTDEKREVFGFKWNGKTAFLVADYYIPKGVKGRMTEDGKLQFLVDNEWVDAAQYHLLFK